ncbi:MAG: hypothetical protein HC787_07320 [Nostocaceae cyanobacterium CSU_2_110]|nr:hypothetical protein [Nostocaceae cyanobacterium CSU_2_110]
MGLAVVLVSSKPIPDGWAAGGPRIVEALLFAALAIGLAVWMFRKLKPGTSRALALALYLVIAFFIYRLILDPAVIAVEANNPAQAGNIGGLGLNSLVAWPVGALMAAAAAWVIGKIALGLREDYLAIANAWDCRNHRHRPSERGLAGAWREEPDRPAPPLARAKGSRSTGRSSLP